jgi:hypothetical protein
MADFNAAADAVHELASKVEAQAEGVSDEVKADIASDVQALRHIAESIRSKSETADAPAPADDTSGGTDTNPPPPGATTQGP